MAPDISRRILAHLQRRDAAPALEFEGEWRSWGWVAEAVDRVNELLESAGVPVGAPVALLARNRPYHHAALLALLSSRRCVVFLNSLQAPESIAGDVESLDIAALVASEADWPIVEAAVRSRGIAGIALEKAGAIAWAADLDKARQVDARDTVAVVLPTSGTTGKPKRIPLSYAGLTASVEDFCRIGQEMGEAAASDSPEASIIQYSPMFHIGGLLVSLQAAMEGRRLVLMERFSPEAWHKAVTHYRPRMTGMPPPILRSVLAANIAPSDIASVQAVRVGTAALDIQSRRALQAQYRIAPLSVFGATEFGGIVASWSLADHEKFAHAKEASAGRVRHHVAQLRIVDGESGAELPRGEPGLLEVNAPRACPGWQRTTDMAVIDDDDFIFILGRADHAINRGGFKVLPESVANVLRQHPSIADVVVVGIPDARLGEVPIAAAELKPGAVAPTVAELDALARKLLSKYQVPVDYLFLNALPRTSVGKVVVAEVQRIYLQSGGREVAPQI